MSVGEWYRVLGAGGRKHLVTDRKTGLAGTYLGFACGRTFSENEVSAASSSGLACATCQRAIAAATKPMPPTAIAGAR